jgi:transposase
MLSAAYHGVSLPLFWIVTNKAGNASLDNRIGILKRAVKKIGVKRIEVLLADREFVGSQWFDFLIRKKIPFIIRTKKNFKAGGIEPYKIVPIEKLLGKMGTKKKMVNYPILLWGQLLYVSIRIKQNAKEPMIVLSNQKFFRAIDIYRKRWGIETLFSFLKTRGFRMEDTHLTCSVKIEKLLFILAIAFCWAIKTGEIQTKIVATKIKKHGRKEKSIFRIGFDLIRSAIARASYKFDDFLSLLQALVPPIPKRRFI